MQVMKESMVRGKVAAQNKSFRKTEASPSLVLHRILKHVYLRENYLRMSESSYGKCKIRKKFSIVDLAEA